MTRTFLSDDGQPRCAWCGAAPEFLEYHDREWGFPVGNDRQLFEKLCLEGFQSGLSWRTILVKRPHFRQAFCDFEIQEVARFDEGDVARLLKDEGIVRHRGKIEAVINNAKRAQDLIETEGALAPLLWRYEPVPSLPEQAQTRSTSDESKKLSAELKKRGWKFVGPTTVYSFMQAMGLINDHNPECITRAKVEQARESFPRPRWP